MEVLRHVHLRLRAGEFVSLIGPSGCGKTTLLRIAAGLDRDFAGVRQVADDVRLGVVFQEPRLLPWRSVEDNIRLALPEGAATISLDALVATLGLAAHMTRYPGELSLGLARRVAIARAFAIAPDFLLLDEPFVSLDEATAARLRDELLTLTQTRAVTTLLVTHDLNDALLLSDRVIALSSRPAHVIADMALPPPRGTRDAAMLSALRVELDAALARG